MTSKETIKETVRAAFDNRVAVRVYNDKVISREDMEFILDSAWLSPSSIGLEGWRFVVLDRPHIAKLRQELNAVAWVPNTSWTLLVILSCSLQKKMPATILNRSKKA